MRKRNYKWFVEPLDSQTNSVFSSQLPVENSQSLRINKQEHNLWECSYQQIMAFQRSKNYINLRFRIYNQEDKGKIRPCDFLFKKRKTKSKTAS